MLNDDLIDDFIHIFMGYGNFSADYWFIGMEEGGGGSLDEVSRRLAIWEARGCQAIEDVYLYHKALDMIQFFQEPVKLQRTWSQLCRVVLSSQGRVDDVQAVKQYQKNHLGRTADSTCLLEMLPLSSPGTNRWFYSQWSHLDFLKSRRTYEEKVIPQRIIYLEKCIKKHHPKFTLFYGSGYSEFWRKIAGTPFQMDPCGFSWADDGKTCFIIMKHPVAKGVTNQYFHDIGAFLKEYIQ